MGGLIAIIIIFLVLAAIFLTVGFFVWRNILRFAKGVERGIKMVPLLIHLPPPSDDIEIGTRDVREVIQEKISQAEVLYNLIAGTAKKGFKSRFYGQRHMSFEIVATDGVIRFYVAVPVALESVVSQAVLTAYPGATLEQVEDHNIFSPTGKLSGTIGGEIVLKHDYAYPIATFTELKRDAMQAMINSLTSLGKGDGAGIQLLIRPAFSGWSKASESLVDKKRKKKDHGHGFLKGVKPSTVGAVLQAPFKVPEKSEDKHEDPTDKQLTSLEQAVVDSIEQKTKHPGYEVMVRVIASSSTSAQSQVILRNISAAFALFDSPGMNGFKFEEAKDMESFVTAFIFRFFPPEARSTILNSVELATLFHLPDDQFTHTSQLQRQYNKQVDGPSNLPNTGSLIGYNQYRGTKKEIRLTEDDRRRHLYILGQTGTGKSTVLTNLIYQDMLEGKGLAFIDPHGDEAEKLMSMIPKDRTEDVIYFNPGDMQFPLGLNMFEFDLPEQKDFLIQEAINMLYRLYDPQHQGIIGPRYEHWFRNAALTLMSDPGGATFIEIPKIFTDKQFQRDKMKYVTDPTVQDFWNKEMAQTSDYHKSEILGWFVSKFGAFMSNEMMRNIIGQVKSSLDLRDIMDSGKILIVNLSKGRVGELNSMLLGMIFVMKFGAAAMSRANIPEAERRDFTLYVDEFQNFSTDTFADILSEARKYRLSLVVANQFIGQLTEEIRDAVFGNVGTMMVSRCGASDADFLVKQFSPTFDTRDLVNLPNGEWVTRLLIGGLPSQPFTLHGLPPVEVSNPKLGAALKQLSAAKYGRPRAQVEAEIFKRLETKPAPNPFGAPGGALGAGMPGQRPLPPGAAPAASRPLGAPTTSGSGSSFLDEWLAKRRQASGTPAVPTQPGTAPASRSPFGSVAPSAAALSSSASNQATPPLAPPVQPAPEPVAVSHTTLAPLRPASTPNKLTQSSDDHHQTMNPHDDHHLRSKGDKPPETKAVQKLSTQPKQQSAPHVPKPGESIMPTHQAKPEDTAASEPTQVVKPHELPKIQLENHHTPAAKAAEQPADKSKTHVEEIKPFGKISADKDQLDTEISRVKDETSKVKEDKKAPPKPTSKPATQNRGVNMPKLQPGEIYIDEEGIIHQSSELAKT